MSKSREYWLRRFKLIEQACHDISLEYLEEMEKKYRDAEQTIQAKINAWYGRFADNNNISMAEARKWLNDKELEELKWNVEQYIKYGKQNAIDGKWAKELENASAKFHISRLEALKLECRQQIEQLTGGMTDDVDSVMQDTYREGYYRSLYEVQKGVSVGFDVAALDTNLVKRIVNKPWHIDGSDFSSSIWSNKAKLLGVIDKEISKMVLTGSSPEKTIRAIQNQMHTSKSNAQRLVLTESAYFTTRAQADSYGELGVELYEVVGTLDKRTCDLCGSFDGKKFPVADMEVGVNAPPFHPRCRCTTCPYDEDSDVFGVGTRAARDENGKTVTVPGDMTFDEWKNGFVVGDIEKPVKPSEDLYKSNRTGQRVIRPNKKDKSVAKNKYGNEIKFDFSKAKKPERFETVKKDIQNLANEYDTYLHDVTIGAVRAAGDTSMDGLIRLNSTKPDTYIHEFAHTLSMQDRVRVGLADEKEVEFMKELARIRTRYENEYQGNPKKGIPSNPSISISAYSHANKDEFFAEAFAHAKMKEWGYEIPEKYGSNFKYSDEVLQLVNKYFKKHPKQ